MLTALTRLRLENEELQETVRQLKDLLAPPGIEPPEGVHLTLSELRIFQHLHNGRVASVDTLLTIVGFHGCEGDTNVIRAHVSRIRGKLAPHGIQILNVRARGYRMVRHQGGVA